MKHSIRYIQVNYTTKGAGKSIQVLRGMEIRQYSYSAKRFDSILDGLKSVNVEMESYSDRITFSRIYPKDL